MKAILIITLILFTTIDCWSQKDFKTKTDKIDSVMRAHIVDNGKRPVQITLSANIGQANPPYDTGKLVSELMKIIM
jgi:hypothetical protein